MFYQALILRNYITNETIFQAYYDANRLLILVFFGN